VAAGHRHGHLAAVVGVVVAVSSARTAGAGSRLAAPPSTRFRGHRHFQVTGRKFYATGQRVRAQHPVQPDGYAQRSRVALAGAGHRERVLVAGVYVGHPRRRTVGRRRDLAHRLIWAAQKPDADGRAAALVFRLAAPRHRFYHELQLVQLIHRARHVACYIASKKFYLNFCLFY